MIDRWVLSTINDLQSFSFRILRNFEKSPKQKSPMRQCRRERKIRIRQNPKSPRDKRCRNTKREITNFEFFGVLPFRLFTPSCSASLEYLSSFSLHVLARSLQAWPFKLVPAFVVLLNDLGFAAQ